MVISFLFSLSLFPNFGRPALFGMALVLAQQLLVTQQEFREAKAEYDQAKRRNNRALNRKSTRSSSFWRSSTTVGATPCRDQVPRGSPMSFLRPDGDKPPPFGCIGK
ncbi:hypothetical protein NL676_004368 [Syzygium grande]|nr:hypothetical protein NL676_004368 [Syzygium grande]